MDSSAVRRQVGGRHWAEKVLNQHSSAPEGGQRRFEQGVYHSRGGMTMSVTVQVFGRRDDETLHALRRPASEKRQGTKSRDVSSGGAAGSGFRGRYGDLAAGSGSRICDRSGCCDRFAAKAE